MHADDDPEAAFRGESEWLELPPPEVAPGFVDRTLAALADAGLVAAAPPFADEPLPQELLAGHAPPPPSRGFVDRALQRVQRDRAEHWRELLLRYESPAPTHDFVARTLRALAGAPRRRRSFPRRWPLPALLAAAAALLLWFAIRPQAPLHELAAAAPPSAAWAHSPALLTHLLARQQPAGSPFQVAGDGAWLWLAAAEARR
jgi:hypothetical protein